MMNLVNKMTSVMPGRSYGERKNKCEGEKNVCTKFLVHNTVF